MNYYTIQRVSNSMLKYALTSLERFKYEWDNILEPKKSTPAMVFGNVVHTLLLEPMTFDSRYFINEHDGRTKEGKEAKQFAEASGLTIISQDDYVKGMDMVSGLTTNAYVAPDLLAKMSFLLGQDLEIEKEINWTDADTGIECKAKLDAYIRSLNLVFDYKSIESLDDHKMDTNFGKYRYDIGGATYSEAIQSEYGDDQFPSFLFCVQEKKAPYAFRLITLDNESLQKGLNKRKELMGKLKTAFDDDDFFTYKDVEKYQLPQWVN